jgi:hypothetical protein
MTYSPPSHGYHSPAAVEANPVGIDYLVRNERIKQDHTNKAEGKHVTKEQMPWGLFGYTYLGMGKQWLNDLLDQTPEFKKEVDLHEAIHTNDEYETRVISKDMLDIESRGEILGRLLKDFYYVSRN